MNSEFFAEYHGKLDHAEKDKPTQVTLLCEGIIDKKRMAQDRLKNWILKGELDSYFERQKKEFDNLISQRLPDLKGFPASSFTLRFTFFLESPYISKDDVSLYIMDNPVKREKVFGLPYVSSTQWKGTLRSAIRHMKGYETWEEEKKDEQMIRIFGNVKGEESNEDLCQGALYFYPTYFEKMGLEVINPHDRETGSGTLPIYFETVAAGASGEFQLLYFPLPPSGDLHKKVCDLLCIARGVKEMMTLHGFGAKTTDGYGRVGKIEKGRLVVKINQKWKERFGCDEGCISLGFETFEELETRVEEMCKVCKELGVIE